MEASGALLVPLRWKNLRFRSAALAREIAFRIDVVEEASEDDVAKDCDGYFHMVNEIFS